jgi:hypothetical protein
MAMSHSPDPRDRRLLNDSWPEVCTRAGRE